AAYAREAGRRAELPGECALFHGRGDSPAKPHLGLVSRAVSAQEEQLTAHAQKLRQHPVATLRLRTLQRTIERREGLARLARAAPGAHRTGRRSEEGDGQEHDCRAD